MRTGTRPDYETYRRIFDARPMPFAYLDRDLLDLNIRDVLTRSRDKTVRVATKSIRSEAVIRRILDADGRYAGLMCFTAPEALHLADRGFDDLLVAYPTWDPRDVDRVARAVGGGVRIILMVDSLPHVEHLEAIAGRVGVRLPLCVEVDMSWDLPGLRFGVWRSPLSGPDETLALAWRIAESPHLELDGLMAYEAQIAGLTDRGQGKRLRGPVVRLLKRRSVPRVADRRAAVVHALRTAGLTLRFVNGGGTGSLETTASEAAVTEVTAGSAFFSPGLFDHYDNFRHAPAVGFAIQIVRRPAPGIFTCLGGGYVASGATGPDKAPVPYLPAGASLLGREGAGEVQTPIRYSGHEQLSLGDPIFMRHAKAGELCERFTHLLVTADGELVDEISTYRGDGLCFL